jgi:hypothetical protein
MEIDKSQIIEHLRSKGDDGKAAQAQSMLPDQVDPDAHGDLLSSLGLDPSGFLNDVPGGMADDADGHGIDEPEGWGGSGEQEGGREGGLGGLAGGLGGGGVR